MGFTKRLVKNLGGYLVNYFKTLPLTHVHVYLFFYHLEGAKVKCAEAKADTKYWKPMSRTVWSCSRRELVRKTRLFCMFCLFIYYSVLPKDTTTYWGGVGFEPATFCSFGKLLYLLSHSCLSNLSYNP